METKTQTALLWAERANVKREQRAINTEHEHGRMTWQEWVKKMRANTQQIRQIDDMLLDIAVKEWRTARDYEDDQLMMF